VFASEDLVRWAPVAGLQALSPTETVVDPLGGSTPQRFYKAMSCLEFALTEKRLTLSEAMEAPAYQRAYFYFYTTPPTYLVAEPPAKSGKPLYASGTTTPLVRIEATDGSQTNIDQLIIDLNLNNDLTDDPVYTVGGGPSPEDRAAGPIFPATRPAGSLHQYGFYLNGWVYNYSPDYVYGYFYLYPASRFEADLRVGSWQQKVALVDSDGNGRLGDYATAQRQYWDRRKFFCRMEARDTLLRDADRSGQFRGSREVEFLGQVLLVDGKAYSLYVSPDDRFLQLEPYPGPVGTATVTPLPDLVEYLELARVAGLTECEPVFAVPKQGQFELPAGAYQLVNVSLSYYKPGKSIYGRASLSTPREPVVVSAGQSSPLPCASPMTVRLTGTKLKATDGTTTVDIRAWFLGPSSEMYTSLSLYKNNLYVKPKVKIYNAADQLVTSVDLEFG
jgi:hypothetical protein